MRICFLTSEVFLGHRHGGFGKLVRIVGSELVKRGFAVSLICWREPGEEAIKDLDGMEVISYPYSFTSRSILQHLIDYTKVIPLIRRADADVYFSIDCMVETFLAQKTMPNRKHCIWVQDPFDWRDYELLGSIDQNYRINRLKFLITTKVYSRAYHNADFVLTQAKFYTPKIAKLYGVDPAKVKYLPNPVEYIPGEEHIKKSKTPTICFIGRMDPQKRYWLFFELARNFPDYEFIAVGKPSLLYGELYKKIVRKYRKLENLRIAGFVGEAEKSEILAKSWVLCLPSIREGLPLSFLEALAHKTSLLSSVNPDGLVDKFGRCVKAGDFDEKLKELLDSNAWKEKGEAGYKYVCKMHSISNIVNGLIENFMNPEERPLKII